MDSGLKLQQMLWYGLIGLFAVFLGYMLASNAYAVVLVILGIGWLILLPYHSRISICLAVATFTSALILPYFPGRLYFWEFAALLGWSGLVVSAFMRKFSPDFGQQIRAHRWLFVGAIGYCAVLLLTMYYRGVGLRILGGSQMGGRFYFQQLSCAVFPFLFVACRLNESTLFRLFVWQSALTATYLVSDFVFSIAPKELFFLLQFFELPSDAVNFAMQAERFGIRRFQSLYIVSTGIFFLMLLFFNLRDLFSRKSIFLIPLILFSLGLGLLSGHRYLFLVVVCVSFFCGYAQRFFTAKHILLCTAMGILVLSFTYVFASRLPLTVQRALSVLPGISVDRGAKEDAASTFETRRLLRKAGMELAREYLWMGRGFSQFAGMDFSSQWDPTGVTTHMNKGTFYNGFVGLLVNTGLFGTFFMLLFLGVGTVLAYQILRFLRTHGCEDSFARMCSLVAALWMTNLIAFLLLHGDSEYAMKTFSLQAGLLLACRARLAARLQS